MTFHSVGNGIIIPTDELIFFTGVETTNQFGIFARNVLQIIQKDAGRYGFRSKHEVMDTKLV
jgi:hypothetical protein